MKIIFQHTNYAAALSTTLVAASLTAPLMSPTAAAQGPLDTLVFYGRANVSLQRTDLENGAGDQVQDNWELRSNTSVLGIRGSHRVQQDLRAVFQLEYEVFIDDGNDDSGDDSEFKQRNSYLGLEGPWGRVIAGKHDTPLKLAQGKIDRFNDLLLGDLRFAIEGENRPDNIVMYQSPIRDNWVFRGAFVPGEDNGTSETEHDDLGNAVSLSAEHSLGKHRFAIAHERGDVIDAAVDYATRFVFEHTEQQFSFGVLVQHAEFDGSGDEESLVLSGSLPLERGLVANAQLAYVDLVGGERTQMTVGLDYLLGPNAKAYAYASRIAETVAENSNNLTAGVGFKLLFSNR